MPATDVEGAVQEAAVLCKKKGLLPQAAFKKVLAKTELPKADQERLMVTGGAALVSAYIARNFRASNPAERKALREERRNGGLSRPAIMKAVKARLKEVILPGVDGTMKSLADFVLADVRYWAQKAASEEKGWAARRLWFEKAQGCLEEYGAESVAQLSDEVQADLGYAAGEVW